MKRRGISHQKTSANCGASVELGGLFNNRNRMSVLALTGAKGPKPTHTCKNTTSEPWNCYQARFFITTLQEPDGGTNSQAQLSNRSSAQCATRAEIGIKLSSRHELGATLAALSTVTYKTYRSFAARTVKSLITTPQGWSIA